MHTVAHARGGEGVGGRGEYAIFNYLGGIVNDVIRRLATNHLFCCCWDDN